jgi:disulfide bond formation protein DsbB
MPHMIPMLSQFPITRWPLLMAGGSLLMMFGAWGFQYIGHYDPCALCLDQRHIHITVILIGLASGVALMGRPDLARLTPWVMLLLAAVLLYSAGFAGWHAGIENHWWAGPETCTSTGGAVEVGDLLAAISGGRPIVMCDEAAWRLLGISMAGYNALISAGMAGIAAWIGIKGLKSK